jgi:predicted anti-sigma-YlaC factor YlaD
MDCRKFEDSITDYLDGSLQSVEAKLFLAHSLQCRACRSLLDEVKATLHDCREPAEDLATPSHLEVALFTIAGDDMSFECLSFEEMITEFLDGYVPAAAYHRFEEHAAECGKCSSLLTDVVYAVAACHSVHTYEEVETSETLLSSLVSIAPGSARQLRNRFAGRITVAGRITRLVNAVIPRATQNRRWTFATAASLAFATFAFLLFGFSDDRTVAGIYRQAHVKFAELYSQGTDIYSRKDELAASFERVGKDIGEIWDTLGGKTEPTDRRTRTQQKRNPRSIQPAQSVEKN